MSGDELWGALDLFRDAVLTAGIAGLVLGSLGLFVVLRRMVFVTAVTSQAAGLGVALAFWADVQLAIAVPPTLGALLLAGAATLLVALRRDHPRLTRDGALGFAHILTGALAVLVGSRITQEGHDIASILFGSAVLVRPIDLWLVAGSGVIVIGALLASWRGLLFASFDPDGARVAGLPVALIDTALGVLLALSISVSTRALGALPVFAFAVLPPIAALRIAADARAACLIGGLLGAASGVLGFAAAWVLETPVGATQAAVAGLFALVALAIPAR